ncbi:MAG: hypothetical protein GTN65_11250, partial [Armatimonadetes bacterium]|nr:hypothetical protein [Armatimonadota bacterium]NIO97643.1 hypothetical protein [Armatimonadota bacterium]NIT30196.1 hypothetical protein [Armatimonadota bacterium]
ADQLWYQEETMQALVAELTPVAAEFLQLAEAELRIQASLRGIPPGPAKEERRRKVHW